MSYKRVKRKRIQHKGKRPNTHARRAGFRYNDFDPVLKMEADEEQSLWDEAQDEALRVRADDFNDHTEDVP